MGLANSQWMIVRVSMRRGVLFPECLIAEWEVFFSGETRFGEVGVDSFDGAAAQEEGAGGAGVGYPGGSGDYPDGESAAPLFGFIGIGAMDDVGMMHFHVSGLQFDAQGLGFVHFSGGFESQGAVHVVPAVHGCQ